MKVIIAGGGAVGSRLALLLHARGDQVRVIELDPDRRQRLAPDIPMELIVAGSAADPSVLEGAGIRQAAVVAAVTGADEVNLVVTSLARFEFGAPRTIARVNNPRNAWMFTHEMGVDVALNQADVIGHLIAEEMSLGDMMTLLKLRKGEFSLVEEKVAPGAPAEGRAVRELPWPDQCTLAAVIRKGQLLVPRPDLVLDAADEVLAVAHASQTGALAALLGRGFPPPSGR